MPNPTDNPDGTPFDRPCGYSGQDYHRDDEAALARSDPGGGVDPHARSQPTQAADARDIGPENGRRAWFDTGTGQLHGSGSREGEEFDEGPKGGAGYKQTGTAGESEGRDLKP